MYQQMFLGTPLIYVLLSYYPFIYVLLCLIILRVCHESVMSCLSYFL